MDPQNSVSLALGLGGISIGCLLWLIKGGKIDGEDIFWLAFFAIVVASCAVAG